MQPYGRHIRHTRHRAPAARRQSQPPARGRETDLPHPGPHLHRRAHVRCGGASAPGRRHSSRTPRAPHGWAMAGGVTTPARWGPCRVSAPQQPAAAHSCFIPSLQYRSSGGKYLYTRLKIYQTSCRFSTFPPFFSLYFLIFHVVHLECNSNIPYIVARFLLCFSSE